MKTNQAITLKRKLVYVAVASCFTVFPAFANPTGATVVNGTVGFATQGNTLNITNTPNAIINWQQFGIQAGEVTRFIQQSAQSAVLNRVVGQDPSQILGSLLSNGRVFLINPNGIVFGAGSTVDVAGLVASTLKLSNGDFLAGKLNFTGGVGAGAIDNQGNITTTLAGGNIYLIAPDIKNSGIITSPQGEILLAAGHTVNLLDAGAPDVQVTVSAPATQAINLGTLMAQSGKIGLYAALIDQKGIVNADTAVRGVNGNIVFKASQNITLEPGSLTTASGMAGGVRDGGEIRIVADGTLNMRKDSQVHVDGGVDGGNGGFLELSGKQAIALRGSYTGNAKRAGFKGGTLLLDPVDIFICGASSGGCPSSDSFDTLPSDGAIVASDPGSTLYLLPADMSAGGWMDVSLAATHDITVSTPIVDSDVPSGGSLTLTAGNDININADIGSAGSRFSHDLTLTAGNDVNVEASIYLGNNTLTIAADAAIPSQSIAQNNLGDVNFLGFNNPVTVDTLGALNVTGQNIYLTGSSSDGTGASLTVKGGTVSMTAANDMILSTVSGSSNVVYLTSTTGLSITVGRDLTLNAGGSSTKIHAGGDQHITVGRDLTLNANGNAASISAGGDQYITVSHDLALNAIGGFVSISADGTLQQITVGHDLTLNASGGSSDAKISMDGNQQISVVHDLIMNASGNSADIRANGDQHITVGHDLIMNAIGSSAEIKAGGDQFISVGRNLTLNANGGSAGIRAFGNTGDQHITVGGDLTLNANGSNAYVYAYAGDQTITVAGNLTLTAGGGGAYIEAENFYDQPVHLQTINVGGTLQLSGASGSPADAYIQALSPTSQQYFTIGGDVLLDGGTGDAYISAGYENHFTVGGTVSLTAGLGGGYARIEAGSPDTIYLTFSNLACCGFSVNGIANLIASGAYGAGGSGFFHYDTFAASMVPAILNDTLIVNYLGIAGLPPPVTTAINFYTDETNGSTNLDGLIEGIRYGENEDDNEKPECS